MAAARERAVLAMLLLQPDRVVPVAQLVDAVWSGAPPRSARNQIQGCVSTLRRLLTRAGGEATIVSEPGGYRLRIDPRQVDAHRFRELVAAGRTAARDGRPDAAREAYQAAQALWRGEALTGIDSEPVGLAADALEEERLQALGERFEVELALGAGGELVAELTVLVRQHPYQEKLSGTLMRALCRAGRPADALAEFRRILELLRDELGTEPGEDLQRLHRAVLNKDPALTADPVRSSAPVAATVPRELPPAATCFVGRDRELAAVREAMRAADRESRHRPPVVLFYGPGGIGKPVPGKVTQIRI